MPTRSNDHDAETLARWANRRIAIGARVREVRLAKGLTQESLSLESGLSRNQLISLEWGRSSIAVERLFDLAQALAVDPAQLLVAPSELPTRSVHRGGRQRKPSPGPQRK